MNGSRRKTGKTAPTCAWSVVALLLIVCAAPSRAADKPASQGTIGTGTFSCAKFSKYDNLPNNGSQMSMIVQWVWGFMSAYNARAAFAATYQEEDAPNPVSPPGAAAIVQYIRANCEKNPQSNVANATLELITALGGTVTSTIAFPAAPG